MSTSVFQQIPRDLVIHVFSFLFPTDLGRAGKVCKEWEDLHVHELLWNSVLRELPPLDMAFSIGNPTPSAKDKVLQLLEKDKQMANDIVDLIQDEKQCRLVLNNPPVSLEELEQMPSIGRTLYIRRGLKQDSTELLKLLAAQIGTLANPFTKTGRLSIGDYQRARIGSQLLWQNKYVALFRSAIEKPVGPFQGKELIEILTKWVLQCQLEALHAIACEAVTHLVKFHHNLSVFLENPSNDRTIRCFLIPFLANYGSKNRLNIEDWVACGLKPSIF